MTGVWATLPTQTDYQKMEDILCTIGPLFAIDNTRLYERPTKKYSGKSVRPYRIFSKVSKSML